MKGWQLSLSGGYIVDRAGFIVTSVDVLAYIAELEQRCERAEGKVRRLHEIAGCEQGNCNGDGDECPAQDPVIREGS